MPAFVTHILAGDDVYPMLAPIAKGAISHNYRAFTWGLIGPDVLFYRKAIWGGSTLSTYGDLMHQQKTPELFTAMSRHILSRSGFTDFEVLVCYYAGFICHYNMDKTAHPYVYYLQEKYQGVTPDRTRGGAHHRAEADINTALYSLKTGRSISSFKVRQRFVYDRATIDAICAMYHSVLAEVYHIAVEMSELVACFNDTLNIFTLLIDSTDILVRPLASAVDLVKGKGVPFSSYINRVQVDYDVLNMRGQCWERVDDASASSDESFLDIYNRAVAISKRELTDMFGQIYSGIPFTPDTSLNFDVGAPK